MKPNIKILNIASYALNVLFIVLLIILLAPRRGDNKADRMEGIKWSIMQFETSNLPTRIQSMPRVHDIQIDSIVITNNVKPYTGYLITTWDIDERQDFDVHSFVSNGFRDDYVRTTKTVYVELSDITKKGQHVTWQSNWGAAYNNAEAKK